MFWDSTVIGANLVPSSATSPSSFRDPLVFPHPWPTCTEAGPSTISPVPFTAFWLLVGCQFPMITSVQKFRSRCFPRRTETYRSMLYSVREKYESSTNDRGSAVIVTVTAVSPFLVAAQKKASPHASPWVRLTNDSLVVPGEEIDGSTVGWSSVQPAHTMTQANTPATHRLLTRPMPHILPDIARLHHGLIIADVRTPRARSALRRSAGTRG